MSAGLYQQPLSQPLWDIGRRRFDFTREIAVMGIVNVTPDSFYQRGRTSEAALARAWRMIDDDPRGLSDGALARGRRESARSAGDHSFTGGDQRRRSADAVRASQVQRRNAQPREESTRGRVASRRVDDGPGSMVLRTQDVGEMKDAAVMSEAILVLRAPRHRHHNMSDINVCERLIEAPRRFLPEGLA